MVAHAAEYPTPEGRRLRDALVHEATLPLKPQGRAMLLNLAELHGRSVLPARGCLRYGDADAAHRLIEQALDATATQFDRTGAIWEFYHPQLGDQATLVRKPAARKDPCRDYVGHNPLFAMTDLWRRAGGAVGLPVVDPDSKARGVPPTLRPRDEPRR